MDYSDIFNKWMNDNILFLKLGPITSINKKNIVSYIIDLDKKSNDTILDWLIFEKKIGHGGSGDIFLARDLRNNNFLIIKSGKHVKIIENAKNNPSFHESDSIEYEYSVQLHLKWINFATTFGYFICPNAYASNESFVVGKPICNFKYKNQSGMIVMQNITTLPLPIISSSSTNLIVNNSAMDLKTFYDFFKKYETSKFLKSIYIQLLLSLQIAQEEIEFTHYDLHYGNVLISGDLNYTRNLFQSINKLQNSPNIILNYYIPSIGKYIKVNGNYGLAVMIDFGKSHIKYDKCNENIKKQFGLQHNKEISNYLLRCNPLRYIGGNYSYFIAQDLYYRKVIYYYILLQFNGERDFLKWFVEEKIAQVCLLNIYLQAKDVKLGFNNFITLDLLPKLESKLKDIVLPFNLKDSKFLELDTEFIQTYDIFLIYQILTDKNIIKPLDIKNSIPNYGLNIAIFNPLADIYHVTKNFFDKHFKFGNDKNLHEFSRIISTLDTKLFIPEYTGLCYGYKEKIKCPLDIFNKIYKTGSSSGSFSSSSSDDYDYDYDLKDIIKDGNYITINIGGEFQGMQYNNDEIKLKTALNVYNEYFSNLYFYDSKLRPTIIDNIKRLNLMSIFENIISDFDKKIKINSQQHLTWLKKKII